MIANEIRNFLRQEIYNAWKLYSQYNTISYNDSYDSFVLSTYTYGVNNEAFTVKLQIETQKPFYVLHCWTSSVRTDKTYMWEKKELSFDEAEEIIKETTMNLLKEIKNV